MTPYPRQVYGIPSGFALGDSANLPRVTGHLITNLPQAMLLLIIIGCIFIAVVSFWLLFNSRIFISFSFVYIAIRYKSFAYQIVFQ